MLWIRQLDSLAFKPLAGTEGATLPFWSPDSQSVGFFVNGQVKRAALGGGAQLIGALDSGYAAGGTWSPRGVIVISKGEKGFGQASPGTVTLVTLSTSTGQVNPLTTLDPSRCESGHYWPQFLPDGRHIAFIADCPLDVGSEPVITSLDAPHERRPLPLGLSTASFTSQHVLFVRRNTLMAQRYDFEALSLVGEASAIAEGVDFWGIGHIGMFSVSDDGVVVYAPARSPDVSLRGSTVPGGRFPQSAVRSRTGRLRCHRTRGASQWNCRIPMGKTTCGWWSSRREYHGALPSIQVMIATPSGHPMGPP